MIPEENGALQLQSRDDALTEIIKEEASNPLEADNTVSASPRARSGLSGRTLHRFTSVLVILVLVLLWQLVTMLHIFSDIALPSPLTVLQNLQTLVTVGFAGETLFNDMSASALRIAIGFLAAVVIGVPVGILMGRNEIIFRIIDPIIQFIRPVPPLAYIPLLVVWLGIEELPKIVLIMIGTLPVILINTVSGVRSTPVQRIRVAQSLGATRFQLLRYTILPSALPEIFTGMRVGIGLAWSCLVAAELIAADVGLGWLVQNAGQALQVGMIFVGIIAIGLLGYAMELVIRAFERLAVPWKGHD